MAGLLVMLLLAACGDDDTSDSDNGTAVATTSATAAAGGANSSWRPRRALENSGLLGVLIPLYEKTTGDHREGDRGGSGAAMQMGERGDADVLLVHSRKAEEAFMAAGQGESRARVMYNDFIIVGTKDDRAAGRRRARRRHRDVGDRKREGFIP